MNFYQNMFEECHKERNFLPMNKMHNEIIEISIKTTKPITLTIQDERFEKFVESLTKAYSNIVQYLEKENDFFEPQLIVHMDGRVACKLHIRKKEHDESNLPGNG